MTENQENHIEGISAESVFKLTRVDAAHVGLKAALGVFPFGGVAAEVFAGFIAAPSAKRLEAFLIDIEANLNQLEKKFENLNIKALSDDEVFQTTVIQASQAAIRTHSKEKHEALRNIVVNSAISKTPDENRQAMFIRLCDELTDLHIHLLKFFDQELAPSIDLDDADWRMNIALGELGERLETHYPNLNNQFSFYIEVINDLHKRGLIGNKIPSRAMMARISHHPTSTIFAKEFLAFLKHPLK